MTPCFGDTSYFLALLIPGDVNHAVARAWATRNRRQIITSEYILIEIGNFLSPVQTRPLLTNLLLAMKSDPRIEIIPAASQLLDRGVQLYTDRPDKKWSLTDCISFVVMRDRAIREALTADHHFEQAGFVTLLKLPAQS